MEYPFSSQWCDSTWEMIHGESGNRTQVGHPLLLLWPPSVKLDHGSTSWLSCLLDCCSVACGCRDRCGRNNLCRKSRICVWSVVCGLLELLRSFLQVLVPTTAFTSFSSLVLRCWFRVWHNPSLPPSTWLGLLELNRKRQEDNARFCRQ